MTVSGPTASSAQRRFLVAPEGLPFILVPWLLALVLLLSGRMMGSAWLGLLAALPLGLGLFSAWFFRDPERQVPSAPDLVVSPADGKVMSVEVTPTRVAITIFLNVFNVHVNRAPVTGRITTIDYRKGLFLAAWRPDVVTLNEANTLQQETPFGAVTTVQIAGLIARRIVCRVSPGERLAIGQRFGLIRFGSCTQLILPPAARPSVVVGEKVKGGSSIVARFGAGS